MKIAHESRCKNCSAMKQVLNACPKCNDDPAAAVSNIANGRGSPKFFAQLGGRPEWFFALVSAMDSSILQRFAGVYLRHKMDWITNHKWSDSDVRSSNFVAAILSDVISEEQRDEILAAAKDSNSVDPLSFEVLLAGTGDKRAIDLLMRRLFLRSNIIGKNNYPRYAFDVLPKENQIDKELILWAIRVSTVEPDCSHGGNYSFDVAAGDEAVKELAELSAGWATNLLHLIASCEDPVEYLPSGTAHDGGMTNLSFESRRSIAADALKNSPASYDPEAWFRAPGAREAEAKQKYDLVLNAFRKTIAEFGEKEFSVDQLSSLGYSNEEVDFIVQNLNGFCAKQIPGSYRYEFFRLFDEAWLADPDNVKRLEWTFGERWVCNEFSSFVWSCKHDA